MAYYTTFSGKIEADPPLKYSQIVGTQWERANLPLDVKFEILKEVREHDGDLIIRRRVGALVPVMEDSYKGCDIIQHVQDAIDTFPGHKFTGHFDCVGEDGGDIWRLVIRDRKAMKLEPRIEWD